MSEVTVTWLGHATVLIETGGLRIVTDPILTSGVAHLRRRVAPVEVDPVDVVLISHVHMDHLHLRSLRLVARGARVVAPRGSARLFRSLPIAALDEVGDGDTIQLPPATGAATAVEVQVVHANHGNTRGPHSRVLADPVGYVVTSEQRRTYFAGDTDLFDAMRDFPTIDLALLPIWGWGPTLGERHLDPARAAIAVEWIEPRHVVPIHWGTYTPIRVGRGAPAWIDDPLDAFRGELDARHLTDRLIALRPGERTSVATV